MARALVGAKAKLDNDPRDRQIRDHRRPMQTRWAQELHKTPTYQSVTLPSQINNVSKENNNKIICTGLEKDKKIYLYMHNNHYDVITKIPGFFAHNCYSIATPVRKLTVIKKNTSARMRASVKGFLPAVLKSRGSVDVQEPTMLRTP